LEQARYNTKTIGKRIEVLYPAYRQDIMHPRDIAEDVIISYGYDNIKPEMPKLPTTGREDWTEVFSKKVASVMVGLGLQEVMSYILTNKQNLFGKMNLKESAVAEIENIVSSNWCVFRNWLLPSVLEFLTQNKHVEYPQGVFEIGDCVALDYLQPTKARNARKLAVAVTNIAVNYEQIASYLDAFMKSIGVKYALRKSSHPSFIAGRCADIFVGIKHIGVIGEVSPLVLNNWGLEKPMIAFEVELEKLK
jgi:phenylalanyl-tRNA synthetase beta chain